MIYDDIINDIWWYHQWYMLIGLYHDDNSGIRYIYIILLGYMIILWWYVAIENRGITKTIGNPMGYENTGYDRICVTISGNPMRNKARIIANPFGCWWMADLLAINRKVYQQFMGIQKGNMHFLASQSKCVMELDDKLTSGSLNLHICSKTWATGPLRSRPAWGCFDKAVSLLVE